MRLLLTGLGGTLAPRVAQAASAAGWDVTGWDRAAVPPADAEAGAAWLAQAQPQAIAHLATGDEHWAGRLAAHAAAQGLPFVFTSTAMVFDAAGGGPHRAGDLRDARDDYGRMKIRCEDAVLAAHPGASVLRLGWQIDEAGGGQGNQMLAALDAWQQREGEIAASRLWRPACSFLGDTAAAIVGLLAQPLGGLLHLDANAGEGHAFDRIALALQSAFGRAAWRVRAHDGYRHDQRLLDGLDVPPLSRRLPL